MEKNDVEARESSGSPPLDTHRSAPEIDQGNEAVLLRIDDDKGLHGTLKLARDGRTVLVPQPSTDPNDPLNWPSSKKHMILIIVAISAFCGDFGSAAGVPCIVPQSVEWNMTPNQVNYAGNLNVLMLGIGGIFWIPFSYFWGRAPVLFWTTLAGALFTLGCSLTHDFTSFYVLRALMGLTLTACQTVGLSFIKDMFYFHEHAKKIGLWACIFLASPYLGAMFGNFIIYGTGEWRNVFWMVFGICCLDLGLIVAIGDETWYRRDVLIDEQPNRGNRLMRLTGLWQITHHKNYFTTFAASYYRLFAVIIKPVMLPIMLYYALSFMWAIGINITSSILIGTPREVGGYGFSAKGVGYIYFTPVVAIILGEIFGHFFNDFLANRYAKKHKGVFKPEARLPADYIAAFLMIPGLILLGQTLAHHLHWAAIVIGWGMYVLGVMIASVATTAYALDCYPNGSGEVSAYLNFARTIGGFSTGYFQQPWGLKSGFDVSFGIQAVVVAVATGILTLILFFGERFRKKGGPLHFKGSS